MNRNLMAVAVACGFVLWAGTLHAQDAPHPLEMGFRGARFGVVDTTQFQFQLANGLSGFTVPDLNTPLVQFSLLVRAGYADDEVPGAAEMLEMMFWKGPCWMGPGGFDEAMDRMAGQLNIRMTADMTEITLNVPAEDASQALRVFAGIVRGPCIERKTLEDFQASGVDRDVPIAAVGPGEVPPFVEGSMELAVDLFHHRLFEGHQYNKTLTADDLANLRLEDVEEFHREYFTPMNSVLAVSGWFRRSEIIPEVDQRFADWEERLPPRLRRGDDIETPARQTIRYTSDKLQTWIVIGHELPEIRPRDMPALQVMNYILGGGHFDTRLFREARDKRGLTNDASGFLEQNTRGPGSYTFRTYGRPEVAQELVDIVFSEIDRIQIELVSEEELFVAKGALIDGDFAMQFVNGHAAARTFAENYAKYGTFEPLVLYPEWIDDVSAEDVRDAARRYLHPERMTVLLIEAQ